MKLNVNKQYHRNSEFVQKFKQLKKQLSITKTTDLIEYLVLNYNKLINNTVVIDVKKPYRIIYDKGASSIIELTEHEAKDMIGKVQSDSFFVDDLKIISLNPLF